MLQNYLSEDYSVIYVTVPTLENARDIARVLVDERLAACVSIIPQIISTYRWQEKIEDYSESKLMIKTKTALFDKVATRVKQLHPATLPEIISVKIDNATSEYTMWLFDETT